MENQSITCHTTPLSERIQKLQKLIMVKRFHIPHTSVLSYLGITREDAKRGLLCELDRASWDEDYGNGLYIHVLSVPDNILDEGISRALSRAPVYVFDDESYWADKIIRKFPGARRVLLPWGKDFFTWILEGGISRSWLNMPVL